MTDDVNATPGDDYSKGFDELPLSDRIPEYLAVFGVGLGIAILVGVVIGILSSPSVTASIAYTIMMVGVGFLLVGGLSGSGFHAGGFGSLFTASADEHERGRERERDSADAAEQRARERGVGVDGASPDSTRGRKRDPRAASRRRMEAGPNPRAFWSVVAGFVYVLLGVALVSVFP